MGLCSSLWIKVKQLLEFNHHRQPEVSITDEDLLAEAHQELLEARSLFTQVQDPDMIDYAVFHLLAAEQRYDYLIRRIKAQRGYISQREKGELGGSR
ncbi:MAG TPA: DUF2508 family protein [Syntrophomonadaceae bacterium]|nr:DUF2508 family protein [Syntrophomonadaceae bacterium]HQA07629.1 DUF2508 family protein [Syntrophomonadaceae bacterium]HQE24180.1 DUF2508 family protein [Syntrophomonadaceae bacterium]